MPKDFFRVGDVTVMRDNIAGIIHVDEETEGIEGSPLDKVFLKFPMVVPRTLSPSSTLVCVNVTGADRVAFASWLEGEG